MPRVPLEHLTWSKNDVGRHAWSLADSAICPPDLERLGLPFQVSFRGEQYATQLSLERALGERIRAPGGRVLLTAGASEANAGAFAALLTAGDDVLMEVPGYEPLRRVPEVFGARVRTFDRPEVPGALAATVERALGPATRLVVISDLHNPGGLPIDARDADALAALARARGFRVLCDETFRDALDRPAGTLGGRDAAWVATGSLTKVYGLGGLRIGWISGTPETLAACEQGVNALSVQPSALSIELALRLVPHLDGLRARTLEILASNHATWAAFVARQPRFRGAVSVGTTTWCAFDGEHEGDAFAAFAADRFDLAIPRGSWFGCPRGVRIALSSDPARFGPTLERLAAAARVFEWTSVEVKEPA